MARGKAQVATAVEERDAAKLRREAAVREHADVEQALREAEHSLARPSSPDPHDESLSKRQWERGMQAWRTQLATSSTCGATSTCTEGQRVASA